MQQLQLLKTFQRNIFRSVISEQKKNWMTDAKLYK